ncbi:transcription factor kayak isoform X2 [Antennarius striatus]|uniref:transcription factor kayak isoform X2 n=1 Tax=Antennarius striatus TaxID=241820 RepID=UPI0035B1CF5E
MGEHPCIEMRASHLRVKKSEGVKTGQRGDKRKDKNRDCARKSRKKQTERADELHEELQHLEHSNSTLRKEIASLKRNLHQYTMVLEGHKHSCCLRETRTTCSATNNESVSPSADCQLRSSPRQASASSQVHADLRSTSSIHSHSRQSSDCVNSPRLTLLAPILDSSTSLSSETSVTSSSFSTLPVFHSLFSDDPPSITVSSQTDVKHLCASSLSTDAKSQSGQGAILDCFSVSANSCFSVMNDSLMKQDANLMAPSNAVPPHHVASENTGLAAHGCPMIGQRLHQKHFAGSPDNSSHPSSHSPPSFQDPFLHCLSIPPQVDPEQLPGSAFTAKPSLNEDTSPHPASLLSLLTIPSPFDASEPTSSNLEGSQHQSLTLFSTLHNTTGDLSFSELLEDNDWILQ